MKREPVTTQLGRCRDWAQGVMMPTAAGFQLQMDGDKPLFWYCLDCGFNQDDLYAP